jgi:hypothetical protein
VASSSALQCLESSILPLASLVKVHSSHEEDVVERRGRSRPEYRTIPIGDYSVKESSRFILGLEALATKPLRHQVMLVAHTGQPHCSVVERVLDMVVRPPSRPSPSSSFHHTMLSSPITGRVKVQVVLVGRRASACGSHVGSEDIGDFAIALASSVTKPGRL